MLKTETRVLARHDLEQGVSMELLAFGGQKGKSEEGRQW